MLLMGQTPPASLPDSAHHPRTAESLACHGPLAAYTPAYRYDSIYRYVPIYRYDSIYRYVPVYRYDSMYRYVPAYRYDSIYRYVPVYRYDSMYSGMYLTACTCVGETVAHFTVSPNTV